MRTARAIALATGVALAAACAGTPATQPGTAPSVVAQTDPSQEPGAQWFPDIVDVAVLPRTDTVFDVEVTVSSPYDTPERYADGWRVLTVDGTVLGSHALLHDHASEQPFTRVQTGLVIPAGVETVVVEGRDLVHGYGGATVEVAVPGR